ncbi:hypothetical protein VXQ18_08285 [Brucella abortus]|nr:hypothetical protein [Brucella abortus]
MGDLVFAITTDPAVRAQKLKAGECQLMSYPAPAEYQGAFRLIPTSRLTNRLGLDVAYLAYNTLKAPFDKPGVRKRAQPGHQQEGYH